MSIVESKLRKADRVGQTMRVGAAKLMSRAKPEPEV